MGTYSDSDFERKLGELRDSQKEIQAISAWLVHHRAHSRPVLKIWYKNFKAGPRNRKLTFLYLMNDVVQNSRRKGPEYVRDVAVILPKVFHHLTSIEIDDKTAKSIGRLIEIWDERQIFDKRLIQEINGNWTHKKNRAKARKPSGGGGGDAMAAEERRKSAEIVDVDEMLESPLRKLVKSSTSMSSLEETITLSPRMTGMGTSPGSGDPPEPEELITALQDLENAASSDAEVRERIAKLPPEVSEVSKLEALGTGEEGQALLTQVEDASTLLETYNGRLQQELKDRKQAGSMVSQFLSAQKELLAQAEERLEVYHEKLEKIKGLKEELKHHIAALPDIPVLPTSSRLAPLPNAGDLFQ